MTAKSERLLSVDALRGFDMFWIVGGDQLAHHLAAWAGADPFLALSRQLTHAEWTGFHAYDLVFPLFMFLSGVSLGLVAESRGAGPPLVRAAGRMFVLISLGIAYNWGWNIDPERTRFASVLGLIGATYMIAATAAALRVSAAAISGLAVAVLAATALFQLAIEIPGAGRGILTPEGAINGWLDRLLLPGRLHGSVYDPEGLFAIFSGAAITLAGLAAGRHAGSRRRSGAPPQPVLYALAGAILFAAGIAIAPYYAPIKKLWTATFDIMAIGASLMLLAASMSLFDGGRRRGIGVFFAVIGSNAILIYMAARYFAYPLFKLLANGDFGAPSRLAGVAIIVAAEWLGLYALYRRRIFLRV